MFTAPFPQAPHGDPPRTSDSPWGALAGGLSLALLGGGLVLLWRHNYPAFHLGVEVMTVAVAFTIQMLAWNTRDQHGQGALMLASSGLAAAACLDLLHALAFRGNPFFDVRGPNVATQLWIAARSLQAASLVLAPLGLGRRVDPRAAGAGFGLAAAALAWAVFSGRFPVCYLEGQGLTPFKIATEYVLTGVFLGSAIAAARSGDRLGPEIRRPFVGFCLCMAAGELAFTSFVGVMDIANLAGHLFKLTASWFLYRALFVAAVGNPLGTLFRELKRSEAALRASRDSVQMEVEARTAELRESLELQRGILAAAMDGIWVVDGERRVMEVNEAACRMLGYAREELIGTSVMSLDDHGDPAALEAHLARLRTRGWEHFETQHRRKDGVPVPVEISGALLPGRGAAVFIVRDITRRRLAEAERASLQAQFHHAQKLESLGALAGGVAHDINNVLAAISVLSAVHGDTAEPGGRLARDMGTIGQACARGGKLVGSLLTFARRSPKEERRLALQDVVGEVAALLASTTLQKVRLTTDLEPGLPPVRGDQAALAHALTNLCVNAVDAMPGGGTLSIRTRRDGEGWARLEVEDTGTGMPPEVLARAMDPFFTTKDVGKGTGLGLAIVHATIQAHGGEMSLHSREGAGTTAILRLPLAQDDVPAEAAGAAPKADARALRALLVDDDELILASVPELMRLLGHEIHPFQRAEDALRSLDAGFEPDVALMDLHMPGMGGGELLPLIRERRPDLPVILVTGKADQGALDLVAAHARVRLLGKPFGREELELALRLAVS